MPALPTVGGLHVREMGCNSREFCSSGHYCRSWSALAGRHGGSARLQHSSGGVLEGKHRLCVGPRHQRPTMPTDDHFRGLHPRSFVKAPASESLMGVDSAPAEAREILHTHQRMRRPFGQRPSVHFNGLNDPVTDDIHGAYGWEMCLCGNHQQHLTTLSVVTCLGLDLVNDVYAATLFFNGATAFFNDQCFAHSSPPPRAERVDTCYAG